MTILDSIVARTRQDLEQRRRRRPLAELEQSLPGAPTVRDFRAALDVPGTVRVIAEIKKASPSAGVLRTDFDPVAIARTFADHGAACLSVLTDEPFFQGHLDYLGAIRREVSLPLLRKDFIVDPYQLVEARVAGADCVLLIAEVLDTSTLRDLLRRTHELGMEALVELHDADNLARVLECRATLIGVNNRDLRTFHTDLAQTLRLAEKVPADVLLVSESGIRSHDDLVRLGAAGVRAVLVGESLMRAADIGAQLQKLLKPENSPERYIH